MMIGFASDDGEGAVKLFDEEEAHHLMGKGHSGEGDLLLSCLVDAIGEAIGTTHEEDEALGHTLQLLLHPSAELTTGHLATPFVEQDEHIARLQTIEDGIALELLLLIGREVACVAQVGQLLELRWHIVSEALDIFVDESGIDRACGASGEKNEKFHGYSSWSRSDEIESRSMSSRLRVS